MRIRTRDPSYWICPYCGQPITDENWPHKALEDRRLAHLTCWVDHEFGPPESEESKKAEE